MKFKILSTYLALVLAVDYAYPFPAAGVQDTNEKRLDLGEQNGDLSFFPGCSVNLPWLEQAQNMEEKDILKISEKLKLVLKVIKDAKLKILVNELSNIDDDANCEEACEEHKSMKSQAGELAAPGRPLTQKVNKTVESLPQQLIPLPTEPTTTTTEGTVHIKAKPIIATLPVEEPIKIVEEPTTTTTTEATVKLPIEPITPEAVTTTTTTTAEPLIKPAEIITPTTEKLPTVVLPSAGPPIKHGYVHKNKKHKPHKPGTAGEETEITTTVTKKNHTLGELSSEEESESLEEEYSLEELAEETRPKECPKDVDIIKTVQEETGSTIVSVIPGCDIDLNAVQKALEDNNMNPEQLDELHDKFTEILYNIKEPTLKAIVQDIVDELEEYKEPCPKVCDIVKDKKRCHSHLDSTKNGEEEVKDINEIKSKKIEPQVNINQPEDDEDSDDFHLDARFADDDDTTVDGKDKVKTAKISENGQQITVSESVSNVNAENDKAPSVNKVMDTLRDILGDSATESQNTDQPTVKVADVDPSGIVFREDA